MEDFGEWRKKDDIQSRRLSIIDFSSEDDSLLGGSSESLGQKSEDIFQSFDDDKREELFDRVSANKLQEIPETEELVPQLSECPEPEMVRKNGKCNLRKSLAWDSAFLTCEGIMDAEELSSMISLDKSQGRMLPGIQEEVQRSTDSISTLGSDTLTLESVESSLFEDVRASIQRSRNPVKVTSGGIKGGLGVREAKVGSLVKKVGLASQPKLKPKVVAKNPIISMQIPGKLPRPVRGSQQLSQSMATSSESSSSVLKRPKVLDKPIPSSARMAKRTSLAGDLLKAEKDNTKVVAGRGAPVPKIPGSLRNVPRPTKSSSLGASSTNTTGPTSSIDSSGSTSSVKSVMSPSNSMKRAASKTGNPTNSSRSTPKTQSRAMSGDRIETGKSRLSAQPMPSPRISSNVSPASSISDWSAESDSSISSTQQISYSSRDSLSRSYSSKKVPVEFDSPRSMDHDDKTSNGSASRGFTGNSTSRASTGMVALHQTSKPSGLRLPSPKIGFFDGAKSTMRATPKRSNPVAPSNLPKAGASVGTSPRGSGTKSKHGKVNPEKAATIGGAKTDAQSSFSNMKPKISFSPEASKAATKEVKSGSATPPLMKTNSPLIVDEVDHSNGDEVGNGGSDIGSPNKDVGFCENNETVDASKAELILETQHNAHREEVGNDGDGMSSHNKDIGLCENNEIAGALKSELILETQRSAHQEDVKIGGLSNNSPASYFENASLEELTKDEFKIDKEDYDKGGEVGSGCGYDLGLRDKDIGFSEINEIAGHLKTELTLEDVKITGLSNISPASDLKNANCSEELAKEKSDSEDQIDCLIRQLGSMEIRGTEGMLFDELDNNNGVLQLNSSQDITVSVEKDESQNSLPKPIISISLESDKRIPFSAKDSLCNIGASTEGEKTSQQSPPFSEEHFETEQLS